MFLLGWEYNNFYKVILLVDSMTFYKKELLNMKDSNERKLVITLDYEGSKPRDPEIVFLYYEEFGTHSKSDESELNWAKIQLDIREGHAKDLTKKLDGMPKDVDEVVKILPGNMYWTYVKARRNGSENKSKDEIVSVFI